MKKTINFILALILLITCQGCIPENNIIEKDFNTKTLGGYLNAEFYAYASINKDARVLEIAQHLVQTEKIEFKATAKEVFPGYLDGFKNFNVSDFKYGAVFKPKVERIPMIGYLFEITDVKKIDEFKQSLKDNVNKKWKVELKEEDIYIDSFDNMVFFVICPSNVSDFY